LEQLIKEIRIKDDKGTDGNRSRLISEVQLIFFWNLGRVVRVAFCIHYRVDAKMEWGKLIFKEC
jgi:hypothetical protein